MTIKTDVQWVKKIREMLFYVGKEVEWAERHKSLAPIVVSECMFMIEDLAKQYYLQQHLERRALDAKARAKKAETKKAAPKKEKVSKGRRTGNNPVLAERLAKRKARQAQTQLRVVK